MLHEKAILMKLSMSSFTPNRIDQHVTAETLARHNSDSSGGRFIKRLLPKVALEPVTKLITEIRTYHNQRTLPWSDDGTRMLPIAHFQQYTDDMRALRRRFDLAVDEFCANYLDYIEAARMSLNGMFNRNDYPSPSAVRTKFSFALDPLPVPDGKDFRVTVGRDDLIDMQNSVAARIASAENEARHELLDRIMAPVSAIVNRLRDPDSVFRDSLLGNLREIADLIPGLNVTGDEKIEALRRRIKSELATFDPDTLRENKALRSDAVERAQSIMDDMAVYMAG